MLLQRFHRTESHKIMFGARESFFSAISFLQRDQIPDTVLTQDNEVLDSHYNKPCAWATYQTPSSIRELVSRGDRNDKIYASQNALGVLQYAPSPGEGVSRIVVSLGGGSTSGTPDTEK
jgi:hypothetical protein